MTCQWRLTFQELCRAALRLYTANTYSIRRSISQPVLLSLVTSLGLTQLDYGIVLTGISRRLMDRLQSMLNTTARLVYITVVSATMFHHCCATFTGWESQNALNYFVLLFLCSTAATGQRLHIWQETYSGQLTTTGRWKCETWKCGSWKCGTRLQGWKMQDWKMRETTLYGTPHIAYVYLVLQEASVE